MTVADFREFFYTQFSDEDYYRLPYIVREAIDDLFESYNNGKVVFESERKC